jgi:hypothetical protein
MQFKKADEKVLIKVIGQRTIMPNKISLIAEEAVLTFAKESLVTHISKTEFIRMTKPLRCELKQDIKGKVTVKPVKSVL